MPKRLKEHVKMLKEHPSIIGKALTRDETKRLFDAASSNPRWAHAYHAAVVAANTSLRPVEVKNLRRRDVDLIRKELTVNRAKGDHGRHRRIPLNADALKSLAVMVERADKLGFNDPNHYLWFKSMAAQRSYRADEEMGLGMESVKSQSGSACIALL